MIFITYKIYLLLIKFNILISLILINLLYESKWTYTLLSYVLGSIIDSSDLIYMPY